MFHRLLLSLIVISPLAAVSLLYRLLFLDVWKEPTAHLLQFIRIGLAYDLYVICQLGFVFLISCLVIQKARAKVLAGFCVLWVIFNYIDYTYFLEFRTHIPFSSLQYLSRSQWVHLKDSYWAAIFSWQFLAFCILPILILIVLSRRARSFLDQSRKLILANMALLILIGGLSASYANSFVEDFIHPIQNNGLFYFLVRTSSAIDTTTPLPVPQKELDWWFKHETTLRNRKPLVSDYPFLSAPIDNPLSKEIVDSGLIEFFSSNKPNIVILISESFNADRIGAYNPASDLTPNFDRISRNGLFFENFYANSYQTMRGEFAILCGSIPNPGYAVFKSYLRTRFNCLPEYLKKAGYKTSWIYPHSGNFDSQSVFLTKIGIEQIITEIDFDKNIQRLAWGYGDHELMKKAVSVLREQKQPFFSIILTTTNHHPHTLPDNYIPEKRDENKREATVRYADYAIGLFFDLIRKEEFYYNTLIIVTADTGSSLLSSGKNLKSSIGLPSDQIPLLIHWPTAKSRIRIPALSSQVDIAPAILKLLNIRSYNHFAGQSLLHEHPQRLYVSTSSSDITIAYELMQPENNRKIKLIKSQWANKALKKILNYAYQNDRTWPSEKRLKEITQKAE